MLRGFNRIFVELGIQISVKKKKSMAIREMSKTGKIKVANEETEQASVFKHL